MNPHNKPSQTWPAGRMYYTVARGPDFCTLCLYSSAARGPTRFLMSRFVLILVLYVKMLIFWGLQGENVSKFGF